MLLSWQYVFDIDFHGMVDLLKRWLTHISCETELLIGVLQFIFPMEKAAERIQRSSTAFQYMKNLVCSEWEYFGDIVQIHNILNSPKHFIRGDCG